jgi:hypothetical protein
MIKGPNPPLPQPFLLLSSLLALLLGFTAIASRAKFIRRWATIGVALCMVTLLGACGGGGGGGSSGGGNPGTPRGSYTLTVTGTNQSISHTLNLTLIVN